MGPPNLGRSLQLMGHILSLLVLGDPQQTKLLLNSVEPLVRLERFLCLLENRRLGIQKILEGAILVWLRPLLLWWARAMFCAMRRRASSIVLWLPKNWAKNSLADGGGKSLSLPSWLLPAPARVRVIYKLATISDYWMMSRDCR